MIEAELVLNRETKRTYVYESVKGDGAIKTIYIQKDKLSKPPIKITLTITAAE